MFNRQCTLLLSSILALHLAPAFAAPAAAPDNGAYDFAAARVVNRVILSVIENYYDPARFDPPAMFKTTMDVLQRAIAELKISYGKDDKTALVEVVSSGLSIDMEQLTSPWSVSTALRRVFRFLGEKLPRQEYDFKELEYAAANALLSTLDPHSNALPPEIYEDLRMGTQGEFGGLGIKITTDRRPPCKGNLTVVEVFDQTPAKRAGLKPGDQIVKIGGESTMNIATDEAASRLRGKPGSTVRVQIRRDGNVRTYDLVRESIPIKSVTWKLLDGKVGYIALEAFQGNSATEFEQALQELHQQQMKGLIFDLRGNPGGLLDVAIQIADLFLESGTIVATAGREEERSSVRNAVAAGTEPSYPLVVLIDPASASAAEIIAGALRNQGRALLLGETTFGKGSVQMVQPMPGGGALKLTSAQYLTPGDISIQAVGVAPDVTFIPQIANREEPNLEPDELKFSEATLEHHLNRPSLRTRTDRPGAAIGLMFVPEAERKADRERYERCFVGDIERKPYQSRYEEDFARRLIARTNGNTIEDLLKVAQDMVSEETPAQEKLLQQALTKLGVDWSEPPASQAQAIPAKKSTQVTATATLEDAPMPGKPLKLKVVVRNGSTSPIYRLRAVTKCDNPLLADKELLFGKVAPGKSAAWTAVFELPAMASGRVDPLTVEFKSQVGPVPEPVSAIAEIDARAEPRLAYSYQIEDIANGNGVVEPGEEITMHVAVKNVGRGPTVNAEAGLSAKPGIDVVQGRFEIGKLAPEATVRGVFKLRVALGIKAKSSDLKLTVEDWIPGKVPTTRALLSQELKVAISPPTPAPGAAQGTVTLDKKERTPLLESPGDGARVVATATKGSVLSVDGSAPGFVRVVMNPLQHAWVAAVATTPGGAGKASVETVWVESPQITLAAKSVSRTKSDKYRLQGFAEQPAGVRDLMVFVGDRKVAYLQNPKGSGNARIDFSMDVPVEPGANQITVVARRTNKIISSAPVFVRRD